MRLRIIKDGPYGPVDSIYEADEGTASKLIRHNIAVLEPEDEAPVVETAEAAPAPERAVKRATKPKPRTRRTTK